MNSKPYANTPVNKPAFNKFADILERLPGRKPFKAFSGIVKILTRVFYNFLSSLDQGENLTFMNYGYVSRDPNWKPPELKPEQENVRYQIQMYRYVASAVDWNGLDALEVGSGRGGGAAYIKQHFNPRSLTGVDLSSVAVDFCKRYHASIPGLSFTQGDAENLTFPDQSFDIILNIESSLYYPNIESFLRHVVRLLKPGGYFLYADMRYANEVDAWKGQIQNMGMHLHGEWDITDNAREALALNQEYRQGLVKKYAPRFLQRMFSRFGGSDGGRLSEDGGKDGKRIYKVFILRKAPV